MLSDEDAELYNKTNDWFEENLPNPPFYDDQNSIRAVTWFKDTENISEMLERLTPFFVLAKKYKVEIIRSESEVIPGRLVYEDEYQIGVVKR